MYANDLFVCIIKFLEILINVFLEEAKFEETKVKVLKWTSNNIPLWWKINQGEMENKYLVVTLVNQIVVKLKTPIYISKIILPLSALQKPFVEIHFTLHS